jgi:signal transduction histidine kinase/CHASE2 domain-containing sensor protein
MHRSSWRQSPSLVREWFGLSLLLVLLCGTLTYSGLLRRADLSFFDASSRLWHIGKAQRIAVVAIDDATLSALGGWPLPRRIHAALLDRLTEGGVSAVGLDFVMAQRGRIEPGGDDDLAHAMRRNGKVVTRLQTREINGMASAVLPTPRIAGASYASGHVDANPDRDGVVRSFHLVESDSGGAYDHMAYLLLRASGARPEKCHDVRAVDTNEWVGSCLRYVPLGRHRSYERLSFVDVLHGTVPASALRGRIAIVGETGSGEGTQLTTPMVDGRWLNSVEFLAEETSALAGDTLIHPAGNASQIAFNLSVIPLLCAGLFLLGPRASLVAAIALAIATILMAFALSCQAHVLVFPSGAVATCLVAYPIWSWRRQEALLAYLSIEAARAMNEPSLPDEDSAMLKIIDPVQRRLMVMTNMVARVRRYREFVSEWMDSLPEATLVASSSGIVVLANARAGALVTSNVRGGEAGVALTGRAAADVLFDMTSSHRATAFVAQALEQLSGSTDVNSASGGTNAAFAQGIEMIDAQARSLLIKCATIMPSAQREGALIFHVADVTSMRKAERQRDVTLRFLSHDLRSPQAAILALVEQQRRSPSDFPDSRFRDLVAQYATSALNLADEFLFLARAETQPPRLVELDLVLLLGDAVDDLWPQACAKHAIVQLAAEPGKIVRADVHLLRRAFSNLVGNAIKFSPEGATVRVEVSDLLTAWKVSIVDSGVGMTASESQTLFREFVRIDSGSEQSGHGLGLAFVKSVVDSLGGEVSVQSTLNVGSTFNVLLPKAPST